MDPQAWLAPRQGAGAKIVRNKELREKGPPGG